VVTGTAKEEKEERRKKKGRKRTMVVLGPVEHSRGNRRACPEAGLQQVYTDAPVERFGEGNPAIGGGFADDLLSHPEACGGRAERHPCFSGAFRGVAIIVDPDRLWA
jgi:hypothetical protein